MGNKEFLRLWNFKILYIKIAARNLKNLHKQPKYTTADIPASTRCAKMIHVAQAKELSNTEFLVGDSENLPFSEESFDAVICSNSFHHYPNPQDFFNSAYHVLRKGGRLILRDYTSSDFVVWLMNHLEMPLANLCGHGDVKIHKVNEFIAMAEKAGFTVLTMEKQKGFRAHFVARKS